MAYKGLVYNDIGNWIEFTDDPTSMTAAITATNNTGDSIPSNSAVNLFEGTSALEVRLANSNGGNNYPVVGFTTGVIPDGESGVVKCSGFLSGFSGLLAGKFYYHDPVMPGSITDWTDYVDGEKQQQVGFAINATDLYISIGNVFKKLAGSNALKNTDGMLEEVIEVGEAAQGFYWQGAWSAANTYVLNDVVKGSDGNTYVALQSVPISTDPITQPGNATYWQLFVPKGDAGTAGETGASGDKGDKGDAGEQGIQGEQGSQGETGAKGDKGDKGDAGAAGADGLGFSWQGAWSGANTYVLNDLVKGSDGNTYVALQSVPVSADPITQPDNAAYWQLFVPKGDTGDAGTQGIQGEQGIQGDTGATGATGPSGAYSIDGVSNPGGDIDLVAGTNITITPSDAANTIGIGLSGQVAVANGGTGASNASTALASLGGLASIDGVSNPGGDVDLVAGSNIVITPSKESLSIIISATGIVPRGTTFPISPTTDDRYYRTDRNLEYYYDGTRWLTVQLFSENAPNVVSIAVTNPITASTYTYNRLAFPHTNYSIYLISLDLDTYVATTLNSSNYWTAYVNISGGSNYYPINAYLAVRSANAQYKNHVAINTVYDATTVYFDTHYVKTGSPGACYPQSPRYTWRYVG